MFQFLHSGNVLTLMVNNRSYSVRNDHENFHKICQGLRNLTAEEMLLLIGGGKTHIEKSIVPVVTSKVVVSSDTVTYRGNPVEPCLQQLVDKHKTYGLPLDGLAKFIEKLYGNVSYRVRKELVSFIERNGLTISVYGNIIAYKAVKHNYLDKYSVTISNNIGSVITIDRNLVDDDFTKGCSKGLHAGALPYVYGYGGGNDRIVIVEIDPSDVVSVPSDSSCQKLRTCRYTVVADYNGELNKPVYNTNENLYDSEDTDDDWDWYDNDDYFDDGDVQSIYGIKPSGHKFYNVRGTDGKFTKG